MNPGRHSSRREPTIALINIVFLMLIFFLVAGTIAQPIDQDLTLVQTRQLDGNAPADALVAHRDGRLSFGGRPIAGAADYVAGLDADARQSVRILPDQNLPARELVALGRALRAAGAGHVSVVTEQGI